MVLRIIEGISVRRPLFIVFVEGGEGFPVRVVRGTVDQVRIQGGLVIAGDGDLQAGIFGVDRAPGLQDDAAGRKSATRSFFETPMSLSSDLCSSAFSAVSTVVLFSLTVTSAPAGAR